MSVKPTFGPLRSIKPTARQIRKKRGHKLPTSGMREGTSYRPQGKDNKEILGGNTKIPRKDTNY